MGFMKYLFNQRKIDVESTREFKGNIKVETLQNSSQRYSELCSQYLLMSENNVDGNTRTLFLHETCATDTDNVKRVFADVKVTVFRKAIRDIMY